MPNLSQAHRVTPNHYHCDMASRYRQIAYYALFCMIPAIIYSKALITICYVIIVIAAIMIQVQKRTFSFNKSLAALCLIGISIVLSGINSDNTGQWWHHTVIKLPFLVIPFAFMVLRPISRDMIRTMHLILVVVLSISAAPPLLDILQNHQEILDRLSRGQPVSTPIEHVKYSMFMAYGVISALLWLVYYRSELSSSHVKCFGIGASFLFVVMHLLAVRTGLVIVYASLAFFAIHAAWIKQISRRQVAIAMIAAVIVMYLLSLTPMIQTKLGYMFYDWEQYAIDGGVNYSDSERMFSLQTGLEFFRDNLFLGTGIGDLYDSCFEIYRQQSRSDLVNYPHSQYIYQLAGTGLVGIILFIGGFLYPLTRKSNKYYYLLLALYINYALSFLVENSFERSISVAFFLVFVAMLLSSAED